jgi:ubiquinol-cytochrome c reductase cytochrome b subunit
VLQVIIAGAYRAPREFNFWTGLILLKITLGLALTGYLLPWDQKGYWATNVATNLMTLTPVIGDDLQRIVQGGASYGHHTLTRFFALHAGVLPGLLIAVLGIHIWLFRRHGITTPRSDRPLQYFWPDQVLRDAVACLAVLAIVLLMTLQWDVPAALRGEIDTQMMGAELMAPAEASESYAAARPEWYFLPLFELLKPDYGINAFVGAIVVPGCLLGFLFLMPLIGHWQLGHRFNVVFTFAILFAGSFLMWRAYRADHLADGRPYEPDKYRDAAKQTEYQQRWEGSHNYLAARAQAHREAHRMVDVIRERGGIPADGAIQLYRRDPAIQGPKLFRLHCAGCHSYSPPSTDDASESHPTADNIIPAEQSAGNLYRFGSRDWVAGMLDPKRVDSVDFLGATAHREGDMVTFVHDSLTDLDDEGKQQLAALVAALSAQAELRYQADADAKADANGTIEAGSAACSDLGCADCHQWGDAGDLGTAPDLTGYASADWLREFIANPSHERFYADNNDRMPAFAADRETPQSNTLQPLELELIVRWLREELDIVER